MKILVVEDSDDNRVLAECFLRQGGYEPISACDGADALDYLRSHEPPDAILLDLRMPNIDGWEFLEEQRRDSTIAGIPVVIYSCEHHFRAERGLTPNVVCCVTKTDGRKPLLAAIRAAVASKHCS
jgi:CheY-like chemotaxis protein